MKCEKCDAEFENDKGSCPNCGHEIVSGKKSILVKISIVFLILIIIAVAFNVVASLLHFFDNFPEWVLIAFGISVVAFCIITLLIATTARIQTTLGEYKLGQFKIARRIVNGFTVILILAALLYSLSINAKKSYAYRMMCGTNLKGLGQSLLIYANDYNDVLPWDNWCDKLILYADVSPSQFRCQLADTEYGECSYALNKNFANLKLEAIPADAVMAFETDYGITEERRNFKNNERLFAKEGYCDKDKLNNKVYKNRWNQVGGPELLSLNNHKGEGCNILFWDLHTSFEKPESLAKLNWGMKEGESFPAEVLKYREKLPMIKYRIAGLTALAVLIASVIICIKYKSDKTGKVILFGFITMLMGGIFGFLSEALHSGDWGGAGTFVGVFVAFFAGISYFSFIYNFVVKIKNGESYDNFIVSVAIATGLICSCVIHLILDLIYNEGIYISIIVGMGYGIVAGAILGKIAKKMIIEKKERIVNEIKN